MAAGNTSILIKRSTTTGTPSSLKAGELAYSYLSNTLFIGNSTGTGVVNVGGQYYTTQIDNATTANTPGTIVKRDASGNISVGYITAAGITVGSLIANSANSLSQTTYFGAYGDASAANVAFNGTANVELNVILATVNSNIGTYGNTTTIPSITVDAKGRITSISNNTIATSFTVSGNTGSGSQSGGGTLTVQGNGTGVTTTVTGSGGSETVSIGTDNTVARTNTAGLGTQIFNTDVNLQSYNLSAGMISVTQLNVSGNISYSNAVSTLNVTDPMIYLASNNAADVVDIGMVGHIVGPGNSGFSHYQHLGFVRDWNDRKWKLFSNVSAEPTTTVVFDGNTIYDTIKIGGVDTSYGNIANVNIISANSMTLASALTVGYGGTGATSFTSGAILIGNGTGAISLLANSSFSNTGTAGANSTITSLTVDAYGRTTAAVYTAISGLTVGQGGTGATTFTTNGITYGNGTGALGVTAAAGTLDQTWSNQILTVTNTGVPVWSSAMDGGQF